MRPDDRSARDRLSDEIGETVFTAPDDPKHVVGRIGLGGTFYYQVPATIAERQALGRFLDHYAGRVRAHLSWFGLPERRHGAFKAVSPPRAPASYESLLGVDPALDMACAVGSGGTPNAGWDWEAGPHLCEVQSAGSYAHDDALGCIRFHVPLDAAGDTGAATLLALVEALCVTTQPLYGSAGLVLGYPLDDRFALPAAEAGVFSACLRRCPGIDSVPPQTLRQGPQDKDKVPSVNWLTVLGTGLARPLADAPAFASLFLDGAIALRPYDGGVLMRAGATPRPFGSAPGEMPAPYRLVAAHLAPLRLAEVDNPFSGPA
jgi:hypothetical protein